MTAGYLKALFITLSLCNIIGLIVSDKTVCPAEATRDRGWDYRKEFANGPQHWGETWPDCYGERNSPINIITKDVLKPNSIQRLKLKNFDIPIGNISITNYGLQLTHRPKDGINRSIIFEGNEYPIHPLGFHFHYGGPNNVQNGSEHAIDGRKFPLEVHILFDVPNHIYMQVSSLFEGSNEINPAFDNILSVADQFKYEGDVFHDEIKRDNPDPRRQGKIYLDDIIDFNCPYYRYIGSDPVPTCPEHTTWLVCKTHKKIGYSQLQQLYKMKSVRRDQDTQNDCQLINKHRPLQRKYGRKVYG